MFILGLSILIALFFIWWRLAAIFGALEVININLCRSLLLQERDYEGDRSDNGLRIIERRRIEEERRTQAALSEFEEKSAEESSGDLFSDVESP